MTSHLSSVEPDALPKGLIPIPAEALATAEALYNRGLYLQAAETLKEWGNPKGWSEVSARIFGARLAGNLGASRLASVLFASCVRKNPKNAEARYYRALDLLSSRGPWATWEFLRDFETLPGAKGHTLASALALRGRISAVFKDRRGALTLLEKAHAMEPDSPWIWTEQSMALEFLDEREAALDAAQKALELQPHYRSGVQQAATLLLNANRDEEAEALLRSASEQIESGAVFLQWITALSERERFEVIPELCDRAERLLPWAEKAIKEWLNARRADAFYGLRDFPRAAEYAEACSDPLHQKAAPRLRAPEADARRMKLPVPFVPQDNDTCAPASLASVAGFWNWDVTHDQIVEAVCYGGTQMHGLRQWVEERGWIVREFRVTWQNTQRLIDRGIPFLLATMEVGSGHMQVVEGYDTLWETLLIRDPNFRHHRRVPAHEFLARYEAFGPRGMLVLPATEAQRLEGVELDSQCGFDCFHRFNLALARNDRAAAREELTAMAGEARFLVHGARLALADYDANELERWRCL
ncbi:MAG TPA: C39 family peptidase, partial [Chthoniobacteraceae bacterium]|nr:C39 family peptidase [Chthoniobacteraceae bacterium]